VSTVGIQGVGINVPGVTEAGVLDPIIDNYGAGQVQCAMHAMTVVVKCVDPVTAANGRFYMGAAQGRINRQAFPTYNALALSLITRREMRGFSAAEAMYDNLACCAAPLDPISWSGFGERVPNPALSGNNSSKDSLTPLAIVFAPTATTVNYVIEFYTEWRVIYNSSIDLASTQRIHPATQNSFWDQVRNAVAVAGGSALVGALGSRAGSMLAGRGGAAALGYEALELAPMIAL